VPDLTKKIAIVKMKYIKYPTTNVPEALMETNIYEGQLKSNPANESAQIISIQAINITIV